MSVRDAADGYVHLARALNILPLAMRNYNYTLQLWALKLDFKWMRENKYDVRWEWGSSNTTIYPHLYANTTKQMLIDTKMWSRKEGEIWNQTSLADDVWLTNGFANSKADRIFGRIEGTMLHLLCTGLSFYFIYSQNILMFHY